jgi:hypothetical protein
LSLYWMCTTVPGVYEVFPCTVSGSRIKIDLLSHTERMHQ